MGILDSLTNLSPEQTQGLLAFAANTLQNANTGRPMGFGGALGGGIQAYQQSMDAQRKSKAEQEREAQLQQLRALEIQSQTGGMQQQGMQRDQQAAIDAAAQGAVVDGQFDQNKFLQSVRQINPLKAIEYEQKLAKAGPEFDTKPQTAIGPDGKPFQYILAKNGEMKRLDGALPRDELKLANLGGRDVAYNPYALQEGQSFQRTQTPDSVAQIGATIRGQNLTNARGLEANAIARDRASVEKAPTEFQGKSASYGLRATEADKILNNLGTNYNPAAINSKNTVSNWPLIGGIAGAATNYALSDNDQIAEQAQRDFINATLRQESGAAIGKDEFDNARKQYFPQPGDSKAVIANKAANRQLVIQGFDNSAGKAKMTAPERAPSGGKPASKIVALEGGGSVSAKLGGDGNYYVEKNGKKFRVEE